MKFLLLLFALFYYVSAVNAGQLPFTLGIRDSLMIAHSFHGHPSFGPAGGMHGATYTCDVEFSCEELEPELNWVMDIGKATEIVSKVLSKYNLKNLDEVFPNGEMTTTEFMARKIQEELADLIRGGSLGDDTCEKKWNGRIQVKLWESHMAWASYVGDV